MATCLDGINSSYTKIIADMISKGYVINTDSMSNTSSTVIDFVSKEEPGTVVRLWNLHSSKRVFGSYIDVTSIELRKYPRAMRRLYSDDGELLTGKTFYPVSEKFCVDSLDEFKRIKSIRDQRALNKTKLETDKLLDVKKVSNKFKERIMGRIKRLKGMKNARFDVVKCIHLYYNPLRHNLQCEIRWHSDERHGTLVLG